MAYTTTTNYGLKKGSGGSGQTIEQQRVYDNENADTIDATMKAISDAADAAQDSADDAQAAADTAQGEVDALEILVSTNTTAINKIGGVLCDITLAQPSLAGAWTADESTDTLTCSEVHGLAVTDILVFNAGTGALPTGILAEPEAYYIESIPTTTTVKLKSAWNGSLLDITANGTIGWTVYKCAANISSGTIALDVGYDYNVKMFGGMTIAAASNGTLSYPTIVLNPTTGRKTLGNTTTLPNNVYGYFPSQLSLSKKYEEILVDITIRIISSTYAIASGSITVFASTTSDLTGEPSALSTEVNFRSTCPSAITSIFINQASVGAKRTNGNRIIIRRLTK